MENIFTVVKPFLTLAKAFGLFPMSFEGQPRKGFLKVHWHDLLMTILSLIIAIEMILPTIFKDKDMEFMPQSRILLRAFDIMGILEMYSSIIHLCYQICKRNHILKLLHLIQYHDDEVSNILINFNHFLN